MARMMSQIAEWVAVVMISVFIAGMLLLALCCGVMGAAYLVLAG